MKNATYIEMTSFINVALCFQASRFMAYHTPLKNSQEFTRALMKARELAHNITMGMRELEGTDPNFEVFPYTYVSLFSRVPLSHTHSCDIFIHINCFLSFSCQSDKCILRAVPDNCARGTRHHFSMSATHIRSVLPTVGVRPALRSAQSVDHHYDHCGYCWRHDPMGHWL